jgi:hypothetical protein
MHACIEGAQCPNEFCVAAVAFDERSLRGDILYTSFGEIVERYDLVSTLQQQFGGRRSDESGRASHKNSHDTPLFLLFDITTLVSGTYDTTVTPLA